MNDSDFDNLLKSAKADVPLRDSFKQEVWQRIENLETDSSPEIVRFKPIMATITRPWSAVAGIAAMVTLGLWLGATTAPDAKDAKVAYAESISPFAQAHAK
ncbi:MAG: hypothetical protein V4584_00470 [Verrucomicrobiota bacterium]